jgi:hypothetical protein
MSSECTCYIAHTQNILQLHGILKQHVTIYSPPYSIYNVLEHLLAPNGRQIRIVINHRNRDVQIIYFKQLLAHFSRTVWRPFHKRTHSTNALRVWRPRSPGGRRNKSVPSVSIKFVKTTAPRCRACIRSTRAAFALG